MAPTRTGMGGAVVLSLLLLGACGGDSGPSTPPLDVSGVYAVEERRVSSSCSTSDLAPEDTPSHVELVTEPSHILLYPCEYVRDGLCYALEANAYPVGAPMHPIEDGYEIQILALTPGSASCFASFIDGSVTVVGDRVHVADERRGGIVPDVAPVSCTEESAPPPEELPCLWYEELVLRPLAP